MYPIDIPAIERQARELRAAEIQRINGLFAERTQLLARLAAKSAFAGAHAISEMLRPLFSWNPQESSAPLSASFAPVVSHSPMKAPRALSQELFRPSLPVFFQNFTALSEQRCCSG